MSIKLRLSRHGQKKRPFYRIVATEVTSPRDGRFIELLGTYNPMIDPPAIVLKEDRVKHFIENGAQTSKLVESFIKKTIPGYIEGVLDGRKAKIQAKRKARKARQTK